MSVETIYIVVQTQTQLDVLTTPVIAPSLIHLTTSKSDAVARARKAFAESAKYCQIPEAEFVEVFGENSDNPKHYKEMCVYYEIKPEQKPQMYGHLPKCLVWEKTLHRALPEDAYEMMESVLFDPEKT